MVHTYRPLQLAATYSLEDEAKARGWLEDIVGESIGQNFWDALTDGSYLCKCGALPI